MMKSVFLFALLFTSCNLFFTPQNEWFNKHYFIMSEWERDFYLKLSESERTEFERLFWENRDHWAKQLFIERYELAVIKGYKFSRDAFELIILHGEPFEMRTIYITGVDDFGREIDLIPERHYADIENKTIQIWTYFWNETHCFVHYRLYYEGLSWRRDYAVETQLNIDFDNFDRKKFYGLKDYSDFYSLLYRCSLTAKEKEKIYKKMRKEGE